jgi:hypothetical protein
VVWAAGLIKSCVAQINFVSAQAEQPIKMWASLENIHGLSLNRLGSFAKILLLLIRGPNESSTLTLTRRGRKKINSRNSHINQKHPAIKSKDCSHLEPSDLFHFLKKLSISAMHVCMKNYKKNLVRHS